MVRERGLHKSETVNGMANQSPHCCAVKSYRPAEGPPPGYGSTKWEDNKEANSPVLQLVMMLSSVNSSQHSGSLSTVLFNTGGNIAVRALGSTGWSMELSSASSPSMPSDMFELGRKRVDVVWLSARYKGPLLCRTLACD